MYSLQPNLQPNLTNHQLQAAERVLNTLQSHPNRKTTERMIVLSGYAGTGKTYVIQAISKLLVNAGYSIAAVTHTHKALSVLGADLPEDVECMTIFQALGWRPCYKTGGIIKNGARKIHGHDCIIVDEASMVDEAMYSSLVAATDEEQTPVLWVGDPAQLPPVGYQSSPVFNLVQQQARLEHIVRQEAENPIIAASMVLRECLELEKCPSVEKFAGDWGDGRLTVVKAPYKGQNRTIAEYVADARQYGLDARAIAHRNNTVADIATRITETLHPPGAPAYLEGDPVVFQAPLMKRAGFDRFSREIYEAVANNGAEAVIASAADAREENLKKEAGPLDIDCYSVNIEMLDGEVLKECMVPANELEYRKVLKYLQDKRAFSHKKEQECEETEMRIKYREDKTLAGALIEQAHAFYAHVRYSYATTAHKSQGSTYDVAVVHWDEIVRVLPLSDAVRMLYVACTRPRSYLVIVQ